MTRHITLDDIIGLLTSNAPHANDVALLHVPLGDDASVRRLAEALCKRSDMTAVMLCDNRLNAVGLNALVHALLPGAASLTSLEITLNAIGDEGVVQLAAVLPRFTALQTLMLGVTCMGTDGLRALACALPQVPALTALDISGDKLGGDAMGTFVASLQRCEHLRRIDLCQCELGDADGARLLRAARRHTPLTHLAITHDSLAECASKAAAALVNEHASLVSLDLRANRFDTVGVCRVLDMLCCEHSLRRLSLDENLHDEARCGKHALKRLAHNRVITRLDVFRNTRDALTERMIQAHLDRNSARRRSGERSAARHVAAQ